MSYTSIISRADAAGLIPVNHVNAIIQAATETSVALKVFRRAPMSSGTARLPVLTALPMAAFVVPGDTGLKTLSEVNWSDVMLTAEEIATVIPIPQAVFDDAAFDVWAAAKPAIAEAIGRVLDAAVFFGTNAPASWTGANLVAKAVAAGNVMTAGTATNPAGLLADVNATMAMVEADGFPVNRMVANPALRAQVRSTQLTSETAASMIGDSSLFGVPVTYGAGGLWPVGAAAAELLAGDFEQGVVAIREDINYFVAREGVLTDGAGVIKFNLLQQDLIALRVVARYAFAVPNPVTTANANNATRYPFAVLKTA